MSSQSTSLYFKENVFKVKFWSVDPQFLVAVTSENFGLYGKGTLHILLNIPGYKLEVIKSYNASDALFDVCWMPQCDVDPQILTACGDGKLQLWSWYSKSDQPITSLTAHTREVTSIAWLGSNNILSSSWDGTIKTWDFTHGVNLATFQGHHTLVHEVRTHSDETGNYFISVCGNGTLGFWNTTVNKCIFAIKSHDVDVLSCDYNKFDPNYVATGGSDGIVRYWDFRMPTYPVTQFKASDQSVRRVRFSPHFHNILAVALDDGSTQIWDTKQSHSIDIFKHHEGVVSGLHWCPNTLGGLADCSWDKSVKIFVSSKVRNFNFKI